MSLEAVEKLVAKWQVEHSDALSQAKGETDDQAYTGWMRLAAVTRNHMIELEAALRAEGQGELTEERAQNLARSYLYGAMGYLGISELKDEAVKDVASRLRADFAAAAPSLHKESRPAGCICSEAYGVGPEQCGQHGAALHKEGALTLDAIALARLFHETYERLAPKFGYETRKASAVPWEEVPANNRQLMIAVCQEIFPESALEGHKEGAGGIDNEISITIRGQEQVAIVMEALHKAGFVKAQAATSPAGRAEQERKP